VMRQVAATSRVKSAAAATVRPQQVADVTRQGHDMLVCLMVGAVAAVTTQWWSGGHDAAIAAWERYGGWQRLVSC
jgi:hypothetical protein